jgi:thymidylate synthase ThyX
MISAEIVADSQAPSGARLTTFILKYPRFIHSEFMTHRVLSRNASSSRAIPISKMIEAIQKEPAAPLAFTKNCRGMQAKDTIENQDEAMRIWLEARDAMVSFTQKLSDLGVHKQHANRLLEPFQHITVIASATDWANFFALRYHPDAQPEFVELAKQMWDKFNNATPMDLGGGEWHLPLVTVEEYQALRLASVLPNTKGEYFKLLNKLITQSVARCARVSYNTLDGTANSYEKDLELFQRLVGSAPIHASPTEHQAMASLDSTLRSGNFRGWSQYRKTLSNENILEFTGPK